MPRPSEIRRVDGVECETRFYFLFLCSIETIFSIERALGAADTSRYLTIEE